MMTTKQVIFIFLLLSSNFVAAQNKLTIENLLHQEKLCGAVWTIVEGDSIATYSAGVNNIVTGDKLHPMDKVHVGSITKTVLALGILKLATENKLDIDDPIKKYLSNLPLQNQWEETNPITLRHLLDHTSGLSDLRIWHFFSSSAKPNTPLTEFFTRNHEVLHVKAKPGSVFSYSNMGYTLLGIIIEKITNQSYETYLDNNLLKPVGLHNSTFQFTSQEGEYKTKELAMGHFDDGSTAPALPIYLRPAGQFTTTAKDMGVLIQFMLNKGKIGTDYLIDSTFFEGLGKPNYTIASENGLPNGYALGASLRDRHGVIGIAHSGNIIGYKAMFYIFPNEKKGFFISHNMDSETADYEAFNKLLIEILNVPKIQIKNNDGKKTRGLEKWEGYYVPKITKIEPLELSNIIGSFTKIKLTENGLIILPFQKKETQLHHIGKGIFQATDKVQPSHLLYEEKQRQYITTGISTLQKISGRKILLTAISLALGLIGFVVILISGIYQTIKSNILKKPVIWVFSGVIILTLAVSFIASKSIIYIGDKNTGSVFLYFGSILLPVLSLFSFIAYFMKNKDVIRTIGFWATVFVLQLSILFLLFELIPFKIWM